MSDRKFAFDRGGTPVELRPGETRIGSDQDCEIRIEGAKVEPLQAVVTIDHEGALLQSRGREEDVRVNGMPSRVAELKSGDRVRFGDVELTVDSSANGQKLSGAAGSFDLQTGENPVGRSPEGRVVLNDASVSRNHGVVVVLPGLRILVRDLNSSNGTFVNDRRLGEARLATGDSVEVGAEKLTFVETRLPGAPAAPAPGPAAGAAREFKILVGTEVRPLAPGIHTIGRAAERDITVEDEEVSGSHAQLTVSAQEVRLRDVGSSNGTRVNGQPITSEVTLADGDTIAMGRSELVFVAPAGGDGGDKTVLSSAMPDMGKTVVSGAAGTPAGPTPAAAGGPLALLDLAPGASQEAIQKKFQELYSDFQVRLTNAPTPELKNKFQQKLDELQQVRDQLIAPTPAAGGIDLPSAEPVQEAAAPSAPQDAVEIAEVPDATPALPAEPKKKRGRKKGGKKAAKPKPDKAASGGGLPRSAVIMAVLSVVAIVATVVLWLLFAQPAISRAEATQQALADQQASIESMRERIPQVEQAIASLQEGKVALLENAEFKICNLSSASVWVVWTHSTYASEEGGFQHFDSAFHGYETWEVPAGGTTKFNYVKDDQVIWDGSAVFFSVLMQYRGQEIFRSGAWSGIGSDCYNLALDP